MIPPGFIQDLLARIDIVDIVGRHVELKKAGINHKGLCPFHGEKSPSFIVSPSRQTYHCFGCGVHGNAIGFLMEHTGAGFIEAVEDLAQQVGMQVPQDERSPAEIQRAQAQKAHQLSLTDVLAKATEHYRKQLKGSARAIDYLKRRGLTGPIAAQFGLGYAPEGWRALASAFPAYDDPLLVEAGLVILQDDPDKSAEEQRRYDRFRDRIMFPIRNVQGEVIGFGGRVLDKGEPKYLNSPETPVFSKGRELYGLYEGRTGLRQRGYALVVEGYMDVVALAQHGFSNAVATLGTACTADHVHKLFRFTESVIFSFDGDAAGRRAAGRALEAALPHATDTRSIKFLFLPSEHDPDSYVRELGSEAFERCVERAIPLSRQLIDHCGEGLDLGSAEGRARLLAHAKPLWQQLPQGLLKRQLLGELARMAQLPDQELMGLWQASESRRSAARSEHPASPHAPDDAPWDGPPPDLDELAYVQSGADGVADVGTAPAGNPPSRKPGGEKKPWSKDRKDWKEWKKREQDETYGLPRHQPASPRDHALRMLLLHCAWWELLSDQDHQLLHELPGEHGEVVAWLERYLVNHGPGPWSVLQAALEEDGLLELAQRASGGRLHASDDELQLEDFQRLLRKLWISRLEEESRQLSAGPVTPAVLEQLRGLRLRIQELKAG
ncbi:DNA primase [Mitsuaria sp. WAJ17]|uniref:DNA primase n=1 Tax=Mitsuaria sp. WAJ17 TaxID=2761452 RepID=UPI001600E8E8|nr:DNA primase [Mitsuaria sp. WAJ17]MBB2483968.1 DNA primase [Mitsuaria sp. WAJ17]